MENFKSKNDELAQDIANRVIATLRESGIITLANSNATQSKDEWGTRAEACDIARCSFPTLHGMMNSGAVVFRKVGRKTLLNLTDLRRKLDDGTLAKYHRRG